MVVRLSPTSPGSAQPVERVDARRLWWAGSLTVLAALLTNTLVQVLAHAWFPATQGYAHLLFSDFAPLTVLGVGAGAVVFAALATWARRPISLYRQIAVVVLAVSLIPDVALFGGTDPAAGIVSLMIMHVLDAAVSVGLLTTLPRPREAQDQDAARRAA